MERVEMIALLVAVAILVLGAVAALLAGRSPRWATRLGAGGAVAGALVGLAPALGVLLGGPALALRLPWEVPYGAFAVGLDALSAFFLAPILALSAVAAVFGSEYLQAWRAQRSLGPPWCFFNLLVAAMVIVVVARNAVLFLVAWEVMALASFFLVTFEDEDAEVRDAGQVYLVATHLGTACLVVLFLLLGRAVGSLDFQPLHAPASVGVLFLLALVGFGAKAGFVPLHVWLPEAHPAAPAHVSAVMSGVMIKTGIYGLIRVITLLGPLPAWCGWTLVAVGVTSALLGVLLAIAQHDVKRVLAYSSVENVGIVALGLGVGTVGLQAGLPRVAALGFAGALLHVLNHALAKGLLFLGAGAVVHATGARRLDRLGGLLKSMPATGAAVLVGTVAITALPPLNGFASELLIFLGALRGVTELGVASTVPLLVVLAGLALTSGLASACFTRLFGTVFLGEARSPAGAHAHDPGRAMLAPLLALAAACALVGVVAPWLVEGLAPTLAVVTGMDAEVLRESLAGATHSLAAVVAASLALVILGAALAGLRGALLSGRRVVAAGTWGCGYAAPSPRMQYTASSFAQPLTALFAALLLTRRREGAPAGLFPRDAALATETPDPWRARLYAPAVAGVGRGVAALRWVQHGRIQLYILYIAVTVLVLLVWGTG